MEIKIHLGIYIAQQIIDAFPALKLVNVYFYLHVHPSCTVIEQLCIFGHIHDSLSLRALIHKAVILMVPSFTGVCNDCIR